MALLLGDAGEAFSVPSHRTSTNGRASPFEEAVAIIASENRCLFRSVPDLIKFLAQREPGSYMLINHVSTLSLGRIEEGLKRRDLRGQLRFTYEVPSESLIIKYMPGVFHEVTTMEFAAEIRAKVAQLPGHSYLSVVGLGAAQFEVPGVIKKQGDYGIKPSSRVLATDWPSLMIEVGYSESLRHLRLDAKIWLIHSAGRTKIVIIIRIGADRNSFDFERWELVPNTQTRITRSTPPLVPEVVQAFQIQRNGTVHPANSQLIIPYLKIFDNPHPDAADILLTTNDLAALGAHIFGVLQ